METNVVLAVLFWGCLLLGMPESRGQEAEWRKGTYPDGTLRYEGYFRAGKPAGEMKRYYPDGKLQARMVYRGIRSRLCCTAGKAIVACGENMSAGRSRGPGNILRTIVF